MKRRNFVQPGLLLVEDDAALVLTLTDLLSSKGYRVESVKDGQEALDRASEGGFDLIILDVMLPHMDGFEICRTLRRRAVRTPILMLTARGQVEDKVSGLKLGADDYLAKPFDSSELLARIEALLRRASLPQSSQRDVTFRFGPVTVDFRSTAVWRDGKSIEMSAREFELLAYFIQQQGSTVSRDELLREVWGYDEATMTRTIDAHIWMLRQKLEQDPQSPRHFLTVRGLGYRFVR
ncbi:MAG: response regulator transcription factor [Acidobacteria bacterium]|nr:MAG: response regulator transcription factor [Acidobacteriota bacterium]